MSLKNIRKLIRFEQWYKNLLVFLPAIFSSQAYTLPLLSLAFIGFCCVSSITYIINDWHDREEDRIHPIKKSRPLASGVISGKQAFFVSMILLLIVFSSMIYLGGFYSVILLSYFLITNAYSYGLKNIPIVDILIISTNFLLRMLSGMETFPDLKSLPYFGLLFSILLILLSHKRRSDIKILGKEKASKHKPVLKFYTRQNCYFIRILGFLFLIISFYILWTNGLPLLNILSILILLILTSLYFSKEANLVIKPHYLFKKSLWTLTLAITIFIHLLPYFFTYR